MKTQHEQILAYLQTGKSLTALEALSVANTMKLSTRIGEIRKEHPELIISQEMVTVPSGKRVMRYWIPQQYKQQNLFQ